MVELEAMSISKNMYPIEHLPDRPNEVKNAYCTWTKSRDVLGYKEEIGIKEGIEKMAIWSQEKRSSRMD